LICNKNDKGIETKTKTNGKRGEKRAAEEKSERAAQVKAKE
jgi:hypothetical protein